MNYSSWKFLCLALSIILFISGACYFLLAKKADSYNIQNLATIHTPSEIDPKFIITPNKEIVFSANYSGSFSLYNYRENSIVRTDSSTNVLNPFIFDGRVVGLRDNHGDENFRIAGDDILSSVIQKTIRAIYTFNNGTLIIVQYSNDDRIYILDLKRKTKQILLKKISILHEVCYSQDHNFIVINADQTLWYIELNKIDKPRVLQTNSYSQSMSPSVNGKEIYFANNNYSEYYQLFKIDLEVSINPKLIYYSNHDSKSPKTDSGDLYFVEIVNSEYLLKKMNLTTLKVENITNKGVIYNYDFYNHYIIYSYADLSTPRCIMRYDKQTGRSSNLTGKSVIAKLSYMFLPKTNGRSPAYIMQSTETRAKGVILLFHQGIHGDVSPRWDAILSNLCINGYIIVGPNYSGSSGYGKSHYNATSSALSEINLWANYITQKFLKLPLYYISFSAGNILMEQNLEYTGYDVKAAVSVFGIPATGSPGFRTSSLYILGRQDPFISYNQRNKFLDERAKSSNIEVHVYQDEGHWIRKRQNLDNSLKNILAFFSSHN